MAKYKLRKSQTRVVFTGDGAKIYPVENAFHSGTRFKVLKKYYSPYVDVRRFPSKYSDYNGTWAGPKLYSKTKVIPAKRSRLSYFYENKALHYYSRGLDVLGNWVFKSIICWLILITICIVFLRNDNISTGLAVDKFLAGCKSFSSWGVLVKDGFVELIQNLKTRIVPIEDLGNIPAIVAFPVYFKNLIFVIGFIAQLIVSLIAWFFQLLILLVSILFM